MTREILTARVRPLTKQRLDELARRRGRSVSETVDEVLEKILDDL